ncbi:MAG TPA: UDP-glucose/GDP-mannose dehydrogenase family protein [Patescibacteria group bacterium]|nr:UDP-glucose/GDP-mannose dehydrogenase family protein [Patescibacteria group bacterium]
MTICVIGTGFVGVVSSAVFASFGNIVYGLDVLENKIEKLKKAEIPFFEPGLEELVRSGVEKGTLRFTTSYEEAIKDAEVVILAVGTPSAPDGQADLKYVFAAAESLAPYLKNQAIIAIKSTVPPGTNMNVENRIKAKTKASFATASLPEFLKEGSAVQDTLHPDRIVIGAMEPQVISVLTELHRPFGAEIIAMRSESAQMCKYAANAYLATRITFINQIANLCEVNGADILEVIEGIGHDRRIGSHYWYPGFGYGGSCFPKDVKELAAYAKAIKQNGNLMVKINELNEERIPLLLKRYEDVVGGWKDKRVAILGLSFKPNTDDMREAPSTKLIPLLKSAGASVVAYDPMAMPVAKLQYPDWGIEYATDVHDALKTADVVFELIEWPELISLDVADIAASVNPGAVFIDARNQYASKRNEFQKAGLQYVGVGLV